MSKRYIVIEYDPNTADGGGPIDLFDYLRNELDNANIQTRMCQTTADYDEGTSLEELVARACD